MKSRVLKAIAKLLATTAGLLVLAQVVPYGRTHANPPTTQEPRWDSWRTRQLAERACFDCHSNKTRWPWYADVAPMSWVVQRDVESARDVINFSDWSRPYALSSYSGESVRLGNMPPAKYRVAHPEADLTTDETLELARGFDATLSPPAESR